MEIKEGKNTCGWQEEFIAFTQFLVQGEHFLALSFLLRVLNISSALIKNQWVVGVYFENKKCSKTKRKVLLATACKESRNYRMYFTRQCLS